MSRLSRAEQQERNRARVLAAAKEEFAAHGFREAKVDDIAERAQLTRGAVYSNFPGKRALYFAVLADLVGRTPEPTPPGRGRAAGEALGSFARDWLARLPLAETEEPSQAVRLGAELMPAVLEDGRAKRSFAQLMKLDAILLGLAMECLRPSGAPGAPGRRRVRVAEAVLTMLQGANQMVSVAPGFADPFDVVAACERMAGLEIDDGWAPPHVPFVPPARPDDAPWSPPRAVDVVRNEPARLAEDGVVAILGLHRLEAAEEAVRVARYRDEVTAVLVTGDPDELAPLARLVVADLCRCVRGAFPPSAWPRLRVVFDEPGAVAEAAGLPAVGDGTEAAVRIENGRIVARADGRGACHAAASDGGVTPPAPERPKQ